MTQLQEELRGVRMLHRLPERWLKKLASLARVVEFSTGAVVFRQGDAANDIYIVIDGNVSLEICGPGVGCRRILTVCSGELLGWSPLLSHRQFTASARALSDVRAAALSGQRLRELFEKTPRFGYEFMRCAAEALAQRLNATRLQLLDVYGSNFAGGTNLPGLPVMASRQPEMP
jgi:CRP-like cAMP-binding protein